MQKLDSSRAAELLCALPDWRLDAQRGTISREFVLGDFMQAFAFMTLIAMAAEKHNHHPEWSNVYRRVSITWTTHDVNGLTMNDLEMARVCDHAFAPFAAVAA